jgi:prepilin-type N-terminal cleavage/methylation domain-containing protein
MDTASARVKSRESGHRRLGSSEPGFTLVEIVIVIVVLGIMAGVAIPVVGTFLVSSKQTATKEELQRLVRGIAGTEAGNDRGFEGDVGYPPSALADLTRKPDSIGVWNAFTHLGWNGPYIDSTGGDYLKDAWGQAYVYTPSSRTLESNGSGSAITITF